MKRLSTEDVRRQLLSFEGVKRRFSEKKINSQILIDDYAHHPTEIKATINAARQKYPEREISSGFSTSYFFTDTSFSK